MRYRPLLVVLLLVAGAAAAVGIALKPDEALPAHPPQTNEVENAPPPSAPVANAAPAAPRATTSRRSRIPPTTEQATRRLQVRVTRCPPHLREHYELSACLRRPGPRAASARHHVLHDGATVLAVARELGAWVEIQATHRATGWSTQIARPFVEPGQDSIEIDLGAQRAGVRAHNLRAQVEVPGDLAGTFALTLVPMRFADAGTGPSVSFTPERGHAVVWVHGLLAGSYVPFVEGGGGVLRCELAPLRVQGDTAAELATPVGRSVVVAVEGDEDAMRWLEVRRPNGGRCVHAQRRRAGGVIEVSGLGSGAVLLWATGPRLVSQRIALELHAGQPRSGRAGARLELPARSSLRGSGAGDRPAHPGARRRLGRRADRARNRRARTLAPSRASGVAGALRDRGARRPARPAPGGAGRGGAHPRHLAVNRGSGSGVATADDSFGGPVRNRQVPVRPQVATPRCGSDHSLRGPCRHAPNSVISLSRCRTFSS